MFQTRNRETNPVHEEVAQRLWGGGIRANFLQSLQGDEQWSLAQLNDLHLGSSCLP